MHRRLLRYVLALAAVIAVFWTALTIYVQREVPGNDLQIANAAPLQALVLYHPSRDAGFTDDLSREVSGAFSNAGLHATRLSVHSRLSGRPCGYAIIAVVANTYNWAPDLPTQRYLERADLSGQAVIGLIAGAGSTERAQRILEEKIRATGARVLAVRPFWLWRPNDESRLTEPNRQVALDMARQMARQFGQEAARPALRDNESKQ